MSRLFHLHAFAAASGLLAMAGLCNGHESGEAARLKQELDAASVQILCDIVSAIAGSNDDGMFYRSIVRVIVVVRMHNLALELIEPGNVGTMGDTADAASHDDMTGA